MNKHSILFFLLCSLSPILNAHQNYYLIDGLHEDNSVIKLWYTALGLFDDYDKGLNAGFEIRFNCDGKHFDATYGPNWWQYYFAFTSVGSPDGKTIVRIPRHKRSTIRFNTVCTMSPERAHYLLNTYMHIQPALLKSVNEIKQAYLSKAITNIGVYYQNPIMSEAQESWDPIALCNRVKEEIKDIGACNIVLFTELEPIAAAFSEQFGSECIRVSCLKNHPATTPAERGEHELLTLLLLAECNIVIAPGSYQGIGAKMLNPALTLIELDTIPYALT